MDSVTILPAPEIQPELMPESRWERERRAFVQLFPSLQETHQGRYVAVHDGNVIACGNERIAVAIDAYRLAGYVPLYVGFVGEAPKRRVRLPSPRVLRRTPSA
jgi:hypothetical protein